MQLVISASRPARATPRTGATWLRYCLAVLAGVAALIVTIAAAMAEPTHLDQGHQFVDQTATAQSIAASTGAVDGSPAFLNRHGSTWSNTGDLSFTCLFDASHTPVIGPCQM